ncbi:MAG TPA: hypothetical protein VLE19_07355, partial [Pyrinomonadaceae bacterium]|nr:hypothetical protein [Pyrinomonadaceae bacterium]
MIDIINPKSAFRVIGFLFVAALLLGDALAIQRPQRGNAVRPPAIDYSKFSHSTKKHQAACDTCHKIPTPRWQQTSTYPDVTDFPGHESCVSCHRTQFFKGAKPVICSVCHTKTSPRDEARLPFRNPESKIQFTIEFPHDRHQDVIALFEPVLNKRLSQTFAHVTRVKFVPDDKTQSYNNCTICHSERAVPASPASGWPDRFQPKPETFKSVPAGHDSCFNCHWKSQQPIASNCAGCHKLSTAPIDAAAAPSRISLKFMHEGGGEKKNHVLECASCHINITKAASLRGLKPDVP